MENKLLIVIDAQEDFTRGTLYNQDAINALPVIREIVEYAASNFANPIIYTQDTHFETSYSHTQEGKILPVPHCMKGSNGWNICQEVWNPNGRTIEKGTFGYLDWDIPNVDEIWLCGFCTDICVSANFQILKVKYPEIPIVVFQDACAGVTNTSHMAALEVMSKCQAQVVKWRKS